MKNLFKYVLEILRYAQDDILPVIEVMKFFNTPLIKAIDVYTIEHEPVASIDLMERAARALTAAILERYAGRSFAVFAGPGNNGGDGLAVARMLNDAGCKVAVWLINPKGKLSPDSAVNFERLRVTGVPVTEVADDFKMPPLADNAVVIDAIFGSGLDRPVVNGVFANVIRGIDACGNDVVAVDMPSGLLGGENEPALQLIVLATLTLTLQFPKLSQLFAENEMFVGELQILDIQLSQQAIDETPSPFFYTCLDEIKPLIRPRAKHAHKGTFGRALLVAGSKGMAGASVLAARAALRSGVGLLTVHVPSCNNPIVQGAVPEAMTSIDSCECCFSDTIDTERYTAVGVGPGLGQSKESEAALLALIDSSKAPMVLDADALNILARNPKYMQRLPQGSVITPHVGEFARLFGETDSSYVRLQAAQAYAMTFGVTIVLKGAYTVIVTQMGTMHFNSTGNPGMATGGCGDVLTGCILALMAQGYAAPDAARLAVYVHGLAGDIAANEKGQIALVAGDIVDCLPRAWRSLEEECVR